MSRGNYKVRYQHLTDEDLMVLVGGGDLMPSQPSTTAIAAAPTCLPAEGLATPRTSCRTSS